MSVHPAASTRAPLVVLHGGNGSASEMTPLTDLMQGQARVVALNLAGHGGRTVPASPSLDDVVGDLVEQCDSLGIDRADWFGYSFGGSVAMLMAARHPERVRAVATLATNFVLDDTAVDHMAHLVSPDRLAANGRGRDLADTHAPQDWQSVARYNQALYSSFRGSPPVSNATLGRIMQPSLLIGAEVDPIVSAKDTKRVASLLPNAAYRILPGSLHPLRQAPLGAIVELLDHFLRSPLTVVRRPPNSLLGLR